MSRYRKGAGGKRDENEPEIIKVLRAHGCVVMQLSGKGIPDLLVLRNGTKWLADVKMPGKPTTEAQEELWEEAATKARCPVFILRTPEDAAAMLSNALQPWEPAVTGSIRAPRSHGHDRRPHKGDATKPGGMSVPRNGRDTKKACGCLRSLGRCEHSGNYAPPRSTPMDAAKPVRGLGSEVMAEMLKPPGDENYENALGRALAAAKEAEATFAPKAEPDWHELVDEAVAISKEQCACRLGVLCSYHKSRP